MRTLISFLLLCSIASGTEPYCLIRDSDDRSGCTIAFQDSVAHVLTCSHGKLRKATKVRFRQTNRWLEGIVTARDDAADLAIVSVPLPAGWNVKPVRLADSWKAADRVTMYGYGNLAFYEHRTQIAGPQTTLPPEGGTRTEFIRLKGSGRPGDSGAAVIARGRIVGVNVARTQPEHDALFVPVDEVHQFLRAEGWER